VIKTKTKEERIEIVNKIIIEIAMNDRKFLSNHSDNHFPKDLKKVSHFLLKDNLLYLMDHYRTEGQMINMSRQHHRNPLCHGGTLWALLQDFTNFIKTGKYSNHKNGYGGLYCPHWGYQKESMERIRKVARDLGYLAPNDAEDQILSREAMNGKI